MNLHNLKKEELIIKVEELENKVKELEQDVDYWIKEYNDLEEIKDDLESQIENLEIENGIKDINNFIWKLKIDNLYDPKLENFIENYLKFYNQ